MDISHTITTQSSLHVTQDGGNSVVQGVLFSTSPANIGQEHPQNQGYWSGIYDVISDPNNPRQTISAEWELRINTLTRFGIRIIKVRLQVKIEF
ncbi:hypothetical protein OROHE_009045 [Orobanche hederae]